MGPHEDDSDELAGGVIGFDRELIVVLFGKMDHSDHHQQPPAVTWRTYVPLIAVLLGIVAGVTVWELVQGRFDAREAMRVFMGLFFLVFGFFKLLDWKGFAYAFAEYDLVAKRSLAYAYVYPALELTLGVFFLGGWFETAVNTFTAALMAVSAFGVWLTVRKHRGYRCACLGVVVRLPLSTVTVIENGGMGLMAVLMLLTTSA